MEDVWCLWGWHGAGFMQSEPCFILKLGGDGLPITLDTARFTDWGSRRKRGLLTVTQMVGSGPP